MEEDDSGVEDNVVDDVFDELLTISKNNRKELSLTAMELPFALIVNTRIKITTSEHSEPVFYNSFKSIYSLKMQSKWLNHF